MTGTVEDHYAHHLGPIYTWMVGDPDAAPARGDAELGMLPSSSEGGHALDLGAAGFTVSCDTVAGGMVRVTARLTG